MGDVVSSHLDEAKREMISAETGEVMKELGRLYEQQYAVALFNNVRFDIEGGGGPQPQLLHRKIPLENKCIFSGSLFQYLEESKKWRNRFLFIPDTYNINYYDNKSAYDKGLHPRGLINCAGYKVLTSMEQYMDLISNSLPDVKAKLGSSPFLKCATPFPLILWHPYARHLYFCVVTEKEQQKWLAVLQDCVRHTNDGLSEENKVQTPAFTDTVRLYRQAQGQYGTWDMMCGVPSQILSNLVMESLLPKLRELISPRLKGKLHDRQRTWMLISDAVYSLVQGQCRAQYEALLEKCEAARSALEASIRTDMDQIITSKEHVTSKIRAVVLPKAEKLLKVSIQPYIGSILDALMEPTSRGFFEVRDLFFRELVDMSKNTLNDGTKENVAQHMEKISMLAYHPVKMQSCYEKVEQLSLEGLQQRFDVSSPSVFVQRAQILMREQMDDAVYTFEQILHQSLESQGTEELCKTIQRCQDRVIKKFDYDSSTVRKRFFREALLQIFIPYMLKQLSPSCGSELPRFQELIFEDFSRFILVENIFEEVVLHSVMKDIMMAVKEAAVQRKHNLYRDSIVLGNSDPSLHLLGEGPAVDWAGEYGGAQGEEEHAEGEGGDPHKRRRGKQVVSIIQEEGPPDLSSEACVEEPGVSDIPEEEEPDTKASPVSPGAPEVPPDLSNGSMSAEEEAKLERKEEIPPRAAESALVLTEAKGEEEGPQSSQEVVQEGPPPPPPSEEIPPEVSDAAPEESPDFPPPPHDDSGFQSPSIEGGEEEEAPSKVAPQPAEEQGKQEAPGTVAPQPAEEQGKQEAPGTVAPQPAEEQGKQEAPSTVAPQPAEEEAPSTVAPQPAEEEAPSTVAPQPAEEEAPSTVAPQPAEEREKQEAPGTVAPQPAEEREKQEAPSTVAPQPAEEREKQEAPGTVAPQPAEEREKQEAPGIVAPQPAEEREKQEAPGTVAPQPAEEEAPSTVAPQPAEEQGKLEAPSTVAPQPAEEEAPSTVAPQPAEEQGKLEAPSTVAPQPAEEQGKLEAPSTVAPQPAEEQGKLEAPSTVAPQPAEEQGKLEAPSTVAPQPALLEKSSAAGAPTNGSDSEPSDGRISRI